MASFPLVSVIIGNYNYSQFIAQAIDSVIAQTYQNFELIIVDDGSTDNSEKIISEYNDPRIKKIFKVNGGQASAFNSGFSASEGEIICFLDSDDWWKEEKLQSIVEWHNFLNGEYSILQHNLDIWLNGEIIAVYKNILPVGNCFDEMRKTKNISYFVPTSGLSFPRKVLESIFPIPQEFRISADAYLMRTAFIFGDVYSIPKSLAFYRKHNNSVFNNPSFDVNGFFQSLLFPKLNEFYKKYNIEFEINLPEKTKISKIRRFLKNKFLR